MAGLYESNFSLLGLNISDILMVLLGSGLLGWVGAWLSVLRHLKSIEPR
jgi:cell division transport system permease protein